MARIDRADTSLRILDDFVEMARAAIERVRGSKVSDEELRELIGKLPAPKKSELPPIYYETPDAT